MNLLFLPELFCQITINLNDKEKIFLTSSSKITYNYPQGDEKVGTTFGDQIIINVEFRI